MVSFFFGCLVRIDFRSERAFRKSNRVASNRRFILKYIVLRFARCSTYITIRTNISRSRRSFSPISHLGHYTIILSPSPLSRPQCDSSLISTSTFLHRYFFCASILFALLLFCLRSSTHNIGSRFHTWTFIYPSTQHR